jgi:general secretion pathway protein D
VLLHWVIIVKISNIETGSIGSIVRMKKGSFITSASYLTLLIFMSACNLMPNQNDSEPVDDSEPVEQTITTQPSTSPEIKIETTAPVEQLVMSQNEDMSQYQRQQILEMGSVQFITSPSSKKQLATDIAEGDITLNFQGTDINEFIKVILSDMLNENFVIDPQISGTVTIETSRPISKKELFPLLEEILAINNAVIFKSGGAYQILPREKIVKGNLSPDISAQITDTGYSVKIVPLEYIAAQEMQKILEPFAKDGGSIRVDKQRNLLILGGTPHELNALLETIEIFDVDWLRGMSVGLYPLDHVDAKTLKSELDAILLGVEGNENNELLGGLVRTLTIERLNSVLLISSTTAALREAEIWLYRLDRPGEQIGQNLYVYDVQNAKATDLADMLGHIFGGAGSSEFYSEYSEPLLAPGTTPVEITSSQGVDDIGSDSASAVGTSDLSVDSINPVKIIADDTRNALVILAAARDYKMIAAAIQKLDVVPLQVLIEATILEVTLNDNLNYGVEWFFKNGVGNSHQGQGQLAATEAAIGALSPGFSYTIVNSLGNVRVALNALEEESEIKVLSSPSLMVLDNQIATINVGDEIPIATRSSVSNLDATAPSVNEISYRATGVTLDVLPRVNNSGLVTMEIKQEVSQALETTVSNIDSPTIQQRQITSTVAINSGETIVLGGLIQDIESKAGTGIPILKNLPLIGKLFGTTNDTARRTELIVLITPHVVRNNNDARKITDEFRRKLRSLPPINIEREELIIDKAS